MPAAKPPRKIRLDKIDNDRQIKTKAELFGDIRASKLVIEEGVTYVGKTEVNPNKVAPTAPPRTTEPPRVVDSAGKIPGR